MRKEACWSETGARPFGIMSFAEHLLAVTELRVQIMHFLQLGAFGIALLTLQYGIPAGNTLAAILGKVTLAGCAVVLVMGFVLQANAAELVGSSKALAGEYASPNQFFRIHGLLLPYKIITYTSAVTFALFCLNTGIAVGNKTHTDSQG